MKVTIVSKTGCSRCMLLKQKMKIMGVEFDEADAGTVDVGDMQYPVAIIDGVPYEYSDAIKKLKGMSDESA